MLQPRVRDFVFYRGFIETFETVYPISRFSTSRVAAKEDFNSGTLALRPAGSVLAFLGFPMRVRHVQPYGKPSLSGRREFFLNLISWPDHPWRDMSNRQIAFNSIRAVPAVLWHLAVLPFKLVSNVAKFVAAACPLLLSTIALKASLYIKMKGRQRAANKENYAGVYRFGAGLLNGLGYFAYALYFIGRAVVSPVQGVRQAFHQKSINPMRSNSKVKKLNLQFSLPTRIFLAGLSGVITIVAYSFLLPMALPALIAKLPVLAQVATVLSHSKIGVWLTNALSSVGNIVNPVVGTALEAMGIAAAPSAIMGATSLFSVSVATIAPVVDKVMDELADADDRLNLSNSSRALIQKRFSQSKVVGQPAPVPVPVPQPQPETREQTPTPATRLPSSADFYAGSYNSDNTDTSYEGDSCSL